MSLKPYRTYAPEVGNHIINSKGSIFGEKIMQSIRRIIDDAPAFIPIPEEMRHRRIELIIRPLSDEQAAPVTESVTTQAESAGQPQPSFYDLTKEFCGCIDSGLGDLSTNKKYLEGIGE